MCVPGYLLNCTRRGTGRSNPSREPKFSGANGDREIFIFPVQLTTSRIGNLPRSVCVQTGVSVVIQYSPYSYFLSFFFCLPCLSRELKLSGANWGREIYIFYFPCSADHEQDWQTSSVCVCADWSVGSAPLQYSTVQYSTVRIPSYYSYYRIE